MDKRKVHQAIERWGVTELNYEEEYYYDYRNYDPYNFRDYDGYKYSTTVQANRRYKVKLAMPSEQFERLLTLAEEFEDLLHDRETKELINQARFINRLKYGTTF